MLIWSVFAVAAVLLMDVVPLTTYGILVPVLATILHLVLRSTSRTAAPPGQARGVDVRDLSSVALIYVGTVGLLRLAFVVFTTDELTRMVLAYAAALLLGVAGPVVYTVWMRRRTLATLGITLGSWRRTAILALLLALVQFSITLWRVQLPAPVDWIPLLTMSLAVGLFEAVFFRGFIQGRLEASFGTGTAVLGASVLYALYHVGYGMAGSELLFLFGLGVTYAIAYRVAGSIFVLWPLLTPLGSLFNQLQTGDLAGQLPWASIAGFLDILAVMVVLFWFAGRAGRLNRAPAAPGRLYRA